MHTQRRCYPRRYHHRSLDFDIAIARPIKLSLQPGIEAKDLEVLSEAKEACIHIHTATGSSGTVKRSSLFKVRC